MYRLLIQHFTYWLKVLKNAQENKLFKGQCSLTKFHTPIKQLFGVQLHKTRTHKQIQLAIKN